MSRENKQIYDPKTDSQFQSPYIDVDEWRERVLPDGENVPYQYIHGGFKDTNVKFSFYFPKKENYKGKFYQYLSPFPGPNEEIASLGKNAEDDVIAFSITHGAYFVETNMGSGQSFGPNPEPTMLYRSSAASAEYSREVAARLFGDHRAYGYVFGGSGGGFKTMSCIENTHSWDGAVPYVIGSPVALPNCLTVRVHGLRILRNKLAKIADSLEPGGNGDMYAGLDEEEAATLKEITKMGMPPRAWYEYATMDDGALPVITPGVASTDPGYFHDFWTVPGYLGADPKSSAVRDRIQFRSNVKGVHIPSKSEKNDIDSRNGVDNAWQKMLSDGEGESKPWIELEEVPVGEDLYLCGVNIMIESGSAYGKRLLLGSIEGNRLMIGMCYGMDDILEVLSKIEPGDQIYLDNSDYIAVQTYHRHQVPDQEFTNWDQYRDENGDPKLPQRPMLLGPGFAYSGCGSLQTGEIQGKVIVVASLMDESAFPWQPDWYRKKVESVWGDQAEERFRLWYMDHCKHGDIETTDDELHVTSYLGALHQALLDVSDWVEKGMKPPLTSGYTINDGQVHILEAAKERKGIQPVITLKANGSECSHIKIGETVQFEAKIEVPPNAGKITVIEWSFEGEQDFTVQGSFEENTEDSISFTATVKQSHQYTKPGTYFAVVRVKSNRCGNKTDIFTQVKNICRARVVVE